MPRELRLEIRWLFTKASEMVNRKRVHFLCPFTQPNLGHYLIALFLLVSFFGALASAVTTWIALFTYCHFLLFSYRAIFIPLLLAMFVPLSLSAEGLGKIFRWKSSTHWRPWKPPEKVKSSHYWPLIFPSQTIKFLYSTVIDGIKLKR